MLSDWFKIENLETLETVNGEFGHENMQMIGQNFGRSHSSMSSIYISGIQNEDLGIFISGGVYSKFTIMNYKVEIKSKTNKTQTIISQNFCNSFPHL